MEDEKKEEKKNKMKISQNRLNIENMFGLANKFLVLMDLIVKLFSHISLLTWSKCFYVADLTL